MCALCFLVLPSFYTDSYQPGNRFCGLTRATNHTSQSVLQTKAPNWVFRYDTKPGTWTQILPNPPVSAGVQPAEPQPRYAHQVVYDPGRKMVFLHGGNAGNGCRRRLVTVNEDGYEDERYEGDVDMDDRDEERRERRDKEREGEDLEKENRLGDFWCFTLKRYGFYYVKARLLF
jgi:hypothetical protein